MKKIVAVVAAIIENEQKEVLCALRSTKMILANNWEFPGGKVEKGETIAEAIEREIYEELNCKVKFTENFNYNEHEYDSFIIHLTVVKCKLVEGTPIAKEHDKLIWLKKENLLSLNWAPADVPAVKALVKELN